MYDIVTIKLYIYIYIVDVLFVFGFVMSSNVLVNINNMYGSNSLGLT